jgi:DNA mismatch repair protein MutS
MIFKAEKLTPAMRQYAFFKEKYPDCVLFFRMGDFYETFYEDARICSKVCGLALTSREKGPNPVPLAGVPYHAVDGYLKKMIKAGHKVAVCEQVEDPKTAKGVVKRDVVRVVTAGTLTDESLLDSSSANYLCAVGLSGGREISLSWVDMSTGRFFVRKVRQNRLLEELAAISAAECLLPDCRGQLFENEARKLAAAIAEVTGALITERPCWYFDPYQAAKRLLKHFGTVSLEGFGITDGDDGLVGAAGAVIEYLAETQKTALGHISSITKITQSGILQIDSSSLRSLEVLTSIRGQTRSGSLLDCLDDTLTGMGARLFREWLCRPLCDVSAIGMRQDVVERLKDDPPALDRIRKLLSSVSDIERIAARLATARATPRDLVALGATLRIMPSLRQVLEALEGDLSRQLAVS